LYLRAVSLSFCLSSLFFSVRLLSFFNLTSTSDSERRASVWRLCRTHTHTHTHTHTQVPIWLMQHVYCFVFHLSTESTPTGHFPLFSHTCFHPVLINVMLKRLIKNYVRLGFCNVTLCADSSGIWRYVWTVLQCDAMSGQFCNVTLCADSSAIWRYVRTVLQCDAMCGQYCNFTLYADSLWQDSRSWIVHKKFPIPSVNFHFHNLRTALQCVQG
jgi:hypothetical protein